MAKQLIKVFISVFIVDILTNVGFAYMIGVQLSKDVFVMSGLFTVITVLLLNSIGVLKKDNPKII